MTKIWGLSKRDANYGPAPTPDVRCDKCKYTVPEAFARRVSVGARCNQRLVQLQEFAPQSSAGEHER